MIPIPPPPVLIQLASLLVHADEATGDDAHVFDAVAMRSIVEHPQVQEWLGQVDPVLLPQKRAT